MVNLAYIHGDVHENEAKLLKRFARKLDVTEQNMKRYSKIPLNTLAPSNSADERLETMLDLFKAYFLPTTKLTMRNAPCWKKYAIGLRI